MKILKFLKISLFCLIVTTFNSCSEESSSSKEGIAKISVKLVDDPGDYDEVNIEVIDVLVKFDDDDLDGTDDNDDLMDDGDDDFGDDNEWVSLEAINTGVVNLLDLTGGIDLLLVDGFEVPSGFLKEIRLVLGTNNTIVIDGVEHPLNTPSAQQSGLKIKVNELLEANYSYTFLLDFDVDESIVIAGNSGNINLKPVIRASVEANTGAVSGKVDPSNISTEISTTNGLEIISTNTDLNGNFVLVGLSAGTYILTVTPDLGSGLEAFDLEPIEVTVGNTVDVGILDIDPNN